MHMKLSIFALFIFWVSCQGLKGFIAFDNYLCQMLEENLIGACPLRSSLRNI